jgi:hypothetical protein
MTLLETLEYFLTETAADMESLSWEIREETNFEDNNIEGLSEVYDFNKELYDNLHQIKSIIEAQQWRQSVTDFDARFLPQHYYEQKSKELGVTFDYYMMEFVL